MLKIAALAVLVSVVLEAGAQNPAPPSLWYDAGHVALTVSDSGGIDAAWQFDRADNGDIRIIKEERRGAATVSGALMSICNDQALLFKDIVPARRRELQELNVPVLHLQLVLRLLARALPQGPPAAATQAGIDVADDKNTLRLRKDYSARKDIGAPWRARGNASRGADGEVRFEMVVTYAVDQAPGRQSELKLAGVWQQQSRVKAIDNAFALAGWRVHRVDTVAEVVAGNTMLDPVAMTTPLQFATVGDVRSRIERWWDPDPKAPKRAECRL
jgi:hypothetical protein